MNRLVRAALDSKVNPLALALSQSAAKGALGPLRAATDPHARGSEYFGPGGRTGHPVRVTSSELSHDADLQRRSWEVSERRTGVTYLPLRSPESETSS